MVSPNLNAGARRPNGSPPLWLRVLELDLDHHPTGRLIRVPILSFTKQRTIHGDRWRMPIVPARRVNGDQLEVRCLYCGRAHLHGLGAGHRVAECGLGVGYVLLEVAA